MHAFLLLRDFKIGGRVPMAAYATLPQMFSKPGGKINHFFHHNAISKASFEKMGFCLPDLGFMGDQPVHPSFLGF